MKNTHSDALLYIGIGGISLVFLFATVIYINYQIFNHRQVQTINEHGLAIEYFKQGNRISILGGDVKFDPLGYGNDQTDCDKNPAACLFKVVSHQSFALSHKHRKENVMGLDHRFLLSPFTQADAVACRYKQGKAIKKHVFFMGNYSVPRDYLVQALNEHVRVMQKQTLVAPAVFARGDALFNEFYALSRSELGSESNAIYAFKLTNGFYWVTAMLRGEKASVVAVFEPKKDEYRYSSVYAGANKLCDN